MDSYNLSPLMTFSGSAAGFSRVARETRSSRSRGIGDGDGVVAFQVGGWSGDADGWGRYSRCAWASCR